MKLNIKEIKYIRQSLEFRAKYYQDGGFNRERYKQYFEEIKPIIKKFKALEGVNYIDINKLNKQIK
tara:strand:- start:10 stop:207 length:198 start_codon:yes stop_codon:yes gene_type:complete